MRANLRQEWTVKIILLTKRAERMKRPRCSERDKKKNNQRKIIETNREKKQRKIGVGRGRTRWRCWLIGSKERAVKRVTATRPISTSILSHCEHYYRSAIEPSRPPRESNALKTESIGQKSLIVFSALMLVERRNTRMEMQIHFSLRIEYA